MQSVWHLEAARLCGCSVCFCNRRGPRSHNSLGSPTKAYISVWPVTRQTNTGQMETGECADLTWHQLQRGSVFAKQGTICVVYLKALQVPVQQKSLEGEDAVVKMMDITVKRMKETKLIIHIKPYDGHQKISQYEMSQILLWGSSSCDW